MNREELASGLRTVVQLDAYFEELKAGAAELVARADAQQRGYFSTAEDEATRALLVSYWQSRNALFDLIMSFRRDEQLVEADRPRAFLTAFAAALILVDAARFLRDVVEPRPVVRRKLNEPDPQFGVPGGVYDTVQKSLLSARHAWHLFHAVQYFQQHQAELRRLAAGAGLAPLLAVIDRLQYRLDVPVARFAQAKLRTRADQLMRRLGRNLFGRAMYGLQKFAGSVFADKYLRYGHRPALPTAIAAQLTALLEPGDVLVVRKEYALTNYFLPGYWPHAALYLGAVDHLQQLGIQQHENVQPRWARLLESAAERSPCVLESMKDGVHIRPLASPFASDSIVVLRPQLDRGDVARALCRGFLHEGKPYDFSFDFARSDRLVCTEVVYRAYDGVGAIQLPLVRRLGRLTLSGDDLIQMALAGAHWDPAAVFAPAFAPQVMRGEAAREMIRRAAQAEAGPPPQ